MAATPANPYATMTQAPAGGATAGNLGLGSNPGVGSSNPYLASQITGLTNASNLNLQNNVLPGVDSGAAAAGGYGGSRQGIADANAISQSQTGLDSAIAGLQGGAYTADQNYSLGLGSLANTAQQNQNTFYSQQRQLDQTGATTGAGLVTGADSGLVGQGQGVYNVGTTEQNAPTTALQNASGIYSPYSGLGNGTTTTNQGSTLGGALGAGLAASQVVNNLGLGTSAPAAGSPNPGSSISYDANGNWYYTSTGTQTP